MNPTRPVSTARRRFVATALGGAASAGLGLREARAEAAEWSPSRPVHIVSPYTAGGTNDQLSRLMAQKLTPRLGQPVIVDNRLGANGIVGCEFVARQAPDGLSMAMTSASTHGINPALYPKLPYDAQRDFTPIGLIATVPMMLVVHPSLPVTDVAGLVAYAKAHRGQLSAGSAGVGSTPHLASVLFNMATDADVTHIAYKGDSAALTDLLGGQITMIFANIPSAIGFVHAGKLRALAVTGPKRVESEPQLPTIAEAGLPAAEIQSWYGLMAPANLPAEISKRLADELQAVLATPEVKQEITRLGAHPEPGGQAVFRSTIATDLARYVKIVATAHIKIE
ncbi:MAG TPA: tripartite tricarboxylate transporter substrate binding protein [Burkholderiaceae bacterium]|jgi:tripartite-type tricarboxylate transporter receptor subunit TctC